MNLVKIHDLGLGGAEQLPEERQDRLVLLATGLENAEQDALRLSSHAQSEWLGAGQYCGQPS